MTKVFYEDWLRGLEFSHFITIEPDPSFSYTLNEVIQRLRIIEFKLNKRYLKNSFPKWDAENRFFFMVHPEGEYKEDVSAPTKEKFIPKKGHYHIVLHSPDKIYRKFITNLSFELIVAWLLLPSKHPFQNGYRKQKGLEELLSERIKEKRVYTLPIRNKGGIRIENIIDPTGNAKYISKELPPNVSKSEGWRFPTPPTSKRNWSVVKNR